MAYLLRFDGVNDYVTLASTINISTTDDFSIRWRWPTTSSGNHRVLGGDNVDSSSSRIIHFANGNITVYGGTGGNVGFSQATDQSIDRVIELRRVAGSLSLHYDGQQQGPAQNSSQSFTFGVLGANFSTATVASDLYNIEFEVNGQAISFYDPTASNGAGSILTDTIGSNDGTLVNFPTDNSQWVFYSDATGITADVTESTANFSESSNISVTANITAQITESSSNFSEFSSASFIGNISAQATEVNASFAESSSATITNNIVSVSVTETSQDFSESASASITGSLDAIVTELSQSFTESSTAEISANISAVITELAQDFDESAQVNLTSSFTVEVTETTSDFDEACYVQLPVQRLIPRKVISVNNRSGSTIRVRRRSSVIRVR